MYPRTEHISPLKFPRKSELRVTWLTRLVKTRNHLYLHFGSGFAVFQRWHNLHVLVQCVSVPVRTIREYTTGYDEKKNWRAFYVFLFVFFVAIHAGCWSSCRPSNSFRTTSKLEARWSDTGMPTCKAYKWAKSLQPPTPIRQQTSKRCAPINFIPATHHRSIPDRSSSALVDIYEMI